MTTEQSGSLEIPGLDEYDVASLLNMRNFAYYCNSVLLLQEGKCAFCQLDTILNPVIAENETWHMWDCPIQFRAKDLAGHLVLAPKQLSGGYHTTHIGALTHEQLNGLRDLLWKSVFPKLSGHILLTSVSSVFPVSGEIHAEVVVPDGTQRIEATFNSGYTPEPMNIEQEIHQQGSWSLASTSDTGCGISERFLILPLREIKTFGGITSTDLGDILALAAFTGDELGCGLTGGTFLMGLPGASLAMRFGDPALNAGSIRHLHCNIKWPKPDIHTVSETLAKNPDDIVEKWVILKLWEKMRLYIEAHEGSTEADALASLSQEAQEFLASKKK